MWHPGSDHGAVREQCAARRRVLECHGGACRRSAADGEARRERLHADVADRPRRGAAAGQLLVPRGRGARGLGRRRDGRLTPRGPCLLRVQLLMAMAWKNIAPSLLEPTASSPDSAWAGPAFLPTQTSLALADTTSRGQASLPSGVLVASPADEADDAANERRDVMCGWIYPTDTSEAPAPFAQAVRSSSCIPSAAPFCGCTHDCALPPSRSASAGTQRPPHKHQPRSAESTR